MDSSLSLLADASLEAAAAEEALQDGAFHAALERVDAGRAALAALRERWAGMSAPERAVVGPGARDVRERLDAAQGRVPRLSALTVGTPVDDPEQDTEPD